MGFLDYYVAEDAYLALAKVQGGLAVGSVTGKTFWVDSTHPDASDVAGHGQFNAPFATLDYAIGRCTANKGDTILVAPGHTETITTDGGVTLDVAGVTVRGLGWTTFRPTFTLGSATTASFKVTGAGCRVINLRFIGNIASLDRIIEVAAAGVVISGCEFKNNSASTDVNKAIEVDSGADFVAIDNRILFLSATSASTHGIHLAAACNYPRILRNTIFGSFSSGAILAGTCTDTLIEGNLIVNTGSGAGTWLNVSASTGLAASNLGFSGHATHDAAESSTALALCENYLVALDYSLAGGILPATRSS